MKILKKFILILGLCSIGVSAEESRWWKGNLHTHSLWSDGDDFPEMIIQWYKDNDYQFLALSDHNTISKDKNRWYKIGEREINNKTLEKYKDRFGDWVEEKTDDEERTKKKKRKDERENDEKEKKDEGRERRKDRRNKQERKEVGANFYPRYQEP